MADKKIQDLPLLSQDDFNPSMDYIIVQKPNGATYKMLGGLFSSSIQEGESIAQTKSIDLTYGSTGSFEFFEEFLTASNSAFVVTFNTSILANGSRVKQGSYEGILPIGASRAYTFTKSSGITQVNGVNLGSSFDAEIASFAYTRVYSAGKGTPIRYNVQTNYVAQLDTNVEDTLRFNFSSNQNGSQGNGAWGSEWLIATQVRISATIQGTIRA